MQDLRSESSRSRFIRPLAGPAMAKARVRQQRLDLIEITDR
jgi:hypothetical protein